MQQLLTRDLEDSKSNALMNVLRTLSSDAGVAEEDAEAYVEAVCERSPSLQIDLNSEDIRKWAEKTWPGLSEPRKSAAMSLWHCIVTALFDEYMMKAGDDPRSPERVQVLELLELLSLKLLRDPNTPESIRGKFGAIQDDVRKKVLGADKAAKTRYALGTFWNTVELDIVDDAPCRQSPERLQGCRDSKISTLRMLRLRLEHALRLDSKTPLPLFVGKGMSDHLFDTRSYTAMRTAIVAFTSLTPDRRAANVRLIQKRFELMALIELYSRMLEMLEDSHEIVAALSLVRVVDDSRPSLRESDVERVVERCIVAIENIEWACRRTWQFAPRYRADDERKRWLGVPVAAEAAAAASKPIAAAAAPGALSKPNGAAAGTPGMVGGGGDLSSTIDTVLPTLLAPPSHPAATPTASPAAPGEPGEQTIISGHALATPAVQGAPNNISGRAAPGASGSSVASVASGSSGASGASEPEPEPEPPTRPVKKDGPPQDGDLPPDGEDGEIRSAASEIQRAILGARTTLRRTYWDLRRALAEVLQLPVVQLPPRVVQFVVAGLQPRLETVMGSLNERLKLYMTIRADDDRVVDLREKERERELRVLTDPTPAETLAYRFSDLGVQLLYALKAVRFGSQLIALRAATSSYSELFNRRVYAEGGTPPHLSRLLYMFLGIDATIQLMVLLSLVVVSYGLPVPGSLTVDLKKLREQAKRQGGSFDAPAEAKEAPAYPAFAIDDDFISSFLADYFMSTVATLALGLLVGRLFRRKKFFDLATLGATSVRAYTLVLTGACAVFGAVPFFMLV